MTSRNINIMVALITIFIGAGTLLILPYQISQETIASITNTNSPAFFPIIASFLVILCSLVLFFKTITGDRGHRRTIDFDPLSRVFIGYVFRFYILCPSDMDYWNDNGLYSYDSSHVLCSGISENHNNFSSRSLCSINVIYTF